MPVHKKFHISRLLKVSLIVILITGVLVVTVAAIGNSGNEKISNVRITVSGPQERLFITEADILHSLVKAAGNSLKNQPVGSVNLNALEKQLLKNSWIQKAELYIDNNKILRVNVEESKPVARVFTTDSRSFYVSAMSKILPLSDRFSARVPVFTAFPAFKNKPDSSLLASVFALGSFIVQDEFWMSQIDQVAITDAEKFEMIPKLGNQVIRFGTSDDYEEKFRKLFAFYKEVQVYAGWNKYAVIDLQFKGQIVAERRNASEIKADSLAAIRIMKSIIENAQRDSNDSTRIQMPEKDISEKPTLSRDPSKKTTTPLKSHGDSLRPVNSDNPISLNKEKISESEKETNMKKDEPPKTTSKKMMDTGNRVPKAVMPPKNKTNDNK